MANVNPTALLEALIAASLPAIGTDSTGNVQYSRALTGPEQTSATAIIAAALPGDTSNRVKAIQQAITASAALDGALLSTVTTAPQLRLLLFLVLGYLGWLRWTGTAWAIRIPAITEFPLQ